MLFLLCEFALAVDTVPLWAFFLFFSLDLTDDYLSLVMAEALLEECLQENMDLLRSLTPLLDKTQPKLCRAKSLLNAVLSRGGLTVSLFRLWEGYSFLVACFSTMISSDGIVTKHMNDAAAVISIVIL